MQNVEGEKGRLAAAHLPDGEGENQVVEQDGGAGSPDQETGRAGGTLGPAIGPNRKEHRQIAQGEKDRGAGQDGQVETLDAHHVNGEKNAGQNAGGSQEAQPRKEVESLTQQQAVRKHGIATIRAAGGAGG